MGLSLPATSRQGPATTGFLGLWCPLCWTDLCLWLLMDYYVYLAVVQVFY